jgi:hypothetical protein
MWSAGVILYIMLSATPPFEDDGLYDQITKGDYGFDDEEWDTVAEEPKDLVRKMMEVRMGYCGRRTEGSRSEDDGGRKNGILWPKNRRISCGRWWR